MKSTVVLYHRNRLLQLLHHSFKTFLYYTTLIKINSKIAGNFRPIFSPKKFKIMDNQLSTSTQVVPNQLLDIPQKFALFYIFRVGTYLEV